MKLFTTIGETFTPHVFSALINGIMLIIIGIFFMIDVIGWNTGSSQNCTILPVYSFVVTGCGIALCVYAFFASQAGSIATSGCCGGDDDDDETLDDEVHQLGNQKDSNSIKGNNADQKYSPPVVYITLLIIIGIACFALSFPAVAQLDFCSGRLSLFYFTVSVASWAIGPTLVLASLLLIWRFDYIACVPMNKARYWITNIFIAPISWWLLFFLICSKRTKKQNNQQQQQQQQVQQSQPQHQEIVSQGSLNNAPSSTSHNDDIESNQYGGYKV